MKFKLSQGEFSKALLLANKSLFAKTNLPILSNIMVSASKGKLEILSTNLETATKVVVDCTMDAEGKATLPGKQLFEFVSQLPEGEIVVEKLGEEVLVVTKRYSARFATMPVEDFPAIPKIEKGHSVFVTIGDFTKAIGRVAFCVAEDEGRPVLTGVLFDLSKKSLSLVATDGYRLSFQMLGVEVGEGEAIKAVIPARALMEAAKIVSEYGESLGEGKLEMVFADTLNQVNFKVGEVEYTSRLIEGAFPNWQKLIPTEFTSKAVINKEEFAKIIKVASIFARDAGSIVRLKLEGNGEKGALLSVSAANSQVGSNEAQTEIELVGKGGEIAFNFRYLLEMFSSVEAEDVEFEMIESLNPGRLTIPGEKDYFHIVMPVRLQT